MYNVVSQVIVSINTIAGECNVSAVSEKVQEQVGFEVILLDSKLFPLLDNDATTGVDFWKSTRKIIAASRSLYEKLGGITPGTEFSNELISGEPSTKKRKINEEEDPDKDFLRAKLEEMDNKLTDIKAKITFLDDIVRFLSALYVVLQ